MLDRIGELRVKAWLDQFPEVAKLGRWLDEFDSSARHWIVLSGERLIASGRLSVHETILRVPDAESYVGLFPEPLPAPIASLNRLVVDMQFRRRGLGTQLALARLDAAEQMGCQCAVTSTPSGPDHVRRMEAMGFLVVGPGKPYESGAACGPVPIVLFCHLPTKRERARLDDARFPETDL